MLTVIAACLVLLCAKKLVEPPPVAAQQDALRVILAGIDPQGMQQGLPVTLAAANANATVSVVLKTPATDGIPVNVVQAGGKVVGPDGIPVLQVTRTK
jgi:hypothetical protein